MGTHAEELTTTPADIEATRSDLSRDLDELTDKLSPQRIVERRKDAARSRVSSVRDRLMGTASDARSSMSSAGSSAGDSAGSAVGTVTGSARSAAGSLESTTEGHPLAAGLVAFGTGMLISALLPASSKEAQAADALVTAAKEHGQPVMDEAKSIGQNVGQDLAQSAKESAAQVKETAQDSAQHVQQEGRSAATQVKDEATPS